MKHQLFEISQNVIIKNKDGLVLILKHRTGRWLLPGGRINIGEDSMAGLSRELNEEIGIEKFKIIEILNIVSWIENGQGTYVVTFLIDISHDSNIKLSNEHIAYAWVGLDDLSKYEFWHNDIKSRIKKALIIK